MEHQVQNKILKVICIILSAALIALSVALVTVLKTSPAKQSKYGDTDLPSTSEAETDKKTDMSDETDKTESAETDTIQTYEPDQEQFAIETPYCSIGYPIAYKNYLKQVDTIEDDTYTKTFFCCIKGMEIELFSIYFNRGDTGTRLGSVVYRDSSVSFSVESVEFTPDYTWTEEEKLIYMSMAEAINDVIYSVSVTEGFVSEK